MLRFSGGIVPDTCAKGRAGVERGLVHVGGVLLGHSMDLAPLAAAK